MLLDEQRMQRNVRRMADKVFDIIYIGHEGHDDHDRQEIAHRLP